MHPLPPDVLREVAARRRRIALVVGAGCSLEHPTGLKLASWYAAEAHEQLVRDEVLEDGDCADPSDLSLLATAVFDKTGGQAELVKRLPRMRFRNAQPNSGYMLAAALLREGVLDCLLTLNFDLAMSAALGAVSADEVSVIPGPQASGELGSCAVVYLHRNVEDLDLEAWILTIDALNQQWQGQWEEVVTRRVMATPVVIFAGLGSPAAVLTETISRVRQALSSSQHQVLVVDPSASTQFAGALALPPGAHIQLGWCRFMQVLEARLLLEFIAELDLAATELCRVNGWGGEAEHVSDLAGRLHSDGLLAVGALRSRWLLADELYTPDDARRPMLADLLLGIGLIERASGTQARFRSDGVVEFHEQGALRARVLPVNGQGSLRWAAIEPLALQAVARLVGERPEHILVAGISGSSTEIGVPEDLIADDPDDIVEGFRRPRLVHVDEARSDPAVAASLVA
jgi:hypothetical protein